MLTFDDLTVGREIGRKDFVLSPEVLEAWRCLFPDDRETGDTMPSGMVAIVAMRAYTAVVTPRPPGNVHGEQRFEIARLPRAGDRLTTIVSCVGKTLKKDRRWVQFASETRDADGGTLFQGRQTTLWAA